MWKYTKFLYVTQYLSKKWHNLDASWQILINIFNNSLLCASNKRSTLWNRIHKSQLSTFKQLSSAISTKVENITVIIISKVKYGNPAWIYAKWNLENSSFSHKWKQFKSNCLNIRYIIINHYIFWERISKKEQNT